jgi:hypothetical protein
LGFETGPSWKTKARLQKVHDDLLTGLMEGRANEDLTCCLLLVISAAQVLSADEIDQIRKRRSRMRLKSTAISQNYASPGAQPA